MDKCIILGATRGLMYGRHITYYIGLDACHKLCILCVH